MRCGPSLTAQPLDSRLTVGLHCGKGAGHIVRDRPAGKTGGHVIRYEGVSVLLHRYMRVIAVQDLVTPEVKLEAQACNRKDWSPKSMESALAWRSASLLRWVII